MSEKIYKTMKHTGGFSIAMGIVMIVVANVVGLCSIINGAVLLKRKSDITF